jgi:hypothetical protein
VKLRRMKRIDGFEREEARTTTNRIFFLFMMPELLLLIEY